MDCNLRQGARHLKGTYKGEMFTYFFKAFRTHMGPARALEESVGPDRALEEREEYKKH